jgi:hypothetical protein
MSLSPVTRTGINPPSIRIVRDRRPLRVTVLGRVYPLTSVSVRHLASISIGLGESKTPVPQIDRVDKKEVNP